MIHCVYSVMKAATAPEFFDDVTRHYGKIFQELPDTVQGELNIFVAWVQEHPLRASILKETFLPLSWHEVLFQEFFQDHSCEPLTLQTLRVLSGQKRLAILPAILGALRESQCSQCTVYWHTAKLFSDKELLSLSKKLGKVLGKTVTIRQREKPELLLGGIFLWHDTMIDLSLSTMLSNLHTEIDHVFTCS